jgi:hypothetical protein
LKSTLSAEAEAALLGQDRPRHQAVAVAVVAVVRLFFTRELVLTLLVQLKQS